MVSRSAGRRAAAEEVPHPGPQLVHVEPGRVEHQVGVAAHLAQQFALGRDAVGDPAGALQRVRPPLAVEPAHQRVLGGLEEHHPGGRAARASSLIGRLQVGAERAAARRRPPRPSGTPRPLVRRPGRPSWAAGRAAGCRPRTSPGPPATWPRWTARPGHAGDDHDVGLVVTPSAWLHLPRDPVPARRRDGGRELRADAGHCGDLLDARCPELAHRAEVLEQRGAPGRAEPGHVVERARRWRPCRASAGDR